MTAFSGTAYHYHRIPFSAGILLGSSKNARVPKRSASILASDVFPAPIVALM